ncbi:MAG: S8 family serine peptidase [Planctomycetota bacterium]|nr:S8 family serine peptidase [Planctomycetota bacterium]
MHLAFTSALLATCVLTGSALAQAPQANEIQLRFGSFDPLQGEPSIPADLQSDSLSQLWIVQYKGTPPANAGQSLQSIGVEVHGYLPQNALLVRMPNSLVGQSMTQPAVRWIGRYHPAYRLDPELIPGALAGDELAPARRYNVVVVDKHQDKPALAQTLNQLGANVISEEEGSILLSVAMTEKQLVKAAHLDQVKWIDLWSAPEYDMDNARIQGGGNYVESQVGYTGQGLNSHVYEGIEATHPDFTGGATNVRSGGAASNHGHATAGIVWGNGTSNPLVRGMAPSVGKFYTNNGSVTTSRWQVVSDLVNIHNVSHTTASWGGARTFFYTSISADADDIIFDHDIGWTQSQSNAGNQDSRPQAWAKNIFSIGGVAHFNNSNPADDSWLAGNGSTGPADDGRIKPTLSAYYDSIGTSDRTGAAGYSTANWTSGFGGTSGATPIVAGHNMIAIQMFTDGAFGNTLRNPGGSRHSNRPHFTTLKALMTASAAQYSFNAASTNNRREHCGWGFPDLQKMWDYRAKTFIVDETDILTQGQFTRWNVTVAQGETELKIVLNYAEPAANPTAAATLINDLSLQVTAPDGTTFWGNNGLETGNWSVAGGVADGVNPIETVFVQNPQAGSWTIDIIATRVITDSHVETPALDADYGLVVSGGTGAGGGGGGSLALASIYGQGCYNRSASFLEDFQPASFDLAGTPAVANCVRMTPNGSGYTVAQAPSNWSNPTSANLGMGDDTTTLNNLPFTFNFTGGSTTQTRICSNGFIWLNGTNATADFSPTAVELVSLDPRLAPLWMDMDPTLGGTIHFDTTPTEVFYTWLGVPAWGQAGTTFNMQCVIRSNGEVEYRWRNTSSNLEAVVGWSPGNNSNLPAAVDLSTGLPITLAPDSTGLKLAALSRPIMGSTVTLQVQDIPAGSTLAATVLGLTQFQAGVDLGFLGAGGCRQYCSDELWLFAPILGTTSTSGFGIPADPIWQGFHLYATGITFTPGVNDFGALTANGIDLLLDVN